MTLQQSLVSKRSQKLLLENEVNIQVELMNTHESDKKLLLQSIKVMII